MSSVRHFSGQCGATLIIGLIMLLMLTLMVSSAFTLSGINLKSVGNMQVREEIVAAADWGAEQVIGSPFTNAPAAEDIDVDINNDGVIDYVANIAEPVCLSHIEVPATVVGKESGVQANVPPPASQWNTLWEIKSQVSDPASGAQATVRTGVRVLLSQAEKDIICP